MFIHVKGQVVNSVWPEDLINFASGVSLITKRRISRYVLSIIAVDFSIWSDKVGTWGEYALMVFFYQSLLIISMILFLSSLVSCYILP